MPRCETKFCWGVSTKKGHSPFCSKCRSRRWAEKFPLHYSFKNLRVRAKQRGKPFELTRDQYKQFAVLTGYDKLKGKHSRSLSIHRVDGDKGYVLSNIVAVSLGWNSRMEHANMPQWLKGEMLAVRNGKTYPQPLPHECYD